MKRIAVIGTAAGFQAWANKLPGLQSINRERALTDTIEATHVNKASDITHFINEAVLLPCYVGFHTRTFNKIMDQVAYRIRPQ